MGNTKLLIFFCSFIIFLGLGLLFAGLKNQAREAVSETSGTETAAVSIIPKATVSAALGISGETAFVSRVIDGDTIVVLLAGGGQKTVRFVGMDTPETVDPKRPVGCFGREASNETKNLLSGKKVILQKDVSEVDKYNRLLRYIFLPLDNGQVLFVNDFLVREGYARVLTYPPDVKYNQRFIQAQDQAKELKKGLWGSC